MQRTLLEKKRLERKNYQIDSFIHSIGGSLMFGVMFCASLASYFASFVFVYAAYKNQLLGSTEVNIFVSLLIISGMISTLVGYDILQRQIEKINACDRKIVVLNKQIDKLEE